MNRIRRSIERNVRQGVVDIKIQTGSRVIRVSETEKESRIIVNLFRRVVRNRVIPRDR